MVAIVDGLGFSLMGSANVAQSSGSIREERSGRLERGAALHKKLNPIAYLGNKRNKYVVTQVLSIIGERSVEMNKQMKNFLLVVMVAMLLAACGQVETTPVPEVVVTVEPTNAPEPVDDNPTAFPSDDAGPEDFSQYIGLVYPPSPEGLIKGFSMVIFGKDDYGLSLIINGANKMLWLEKVVQYNAGGSVIWEVKDVLGLSDLEAGLTLIPDGCFLNGVPDSEIFIVGRNGVIVLAWRANTTTAMFEPIPVDGITCDSDKATPL